jgi:tRNA/rRNA methyltransferase
MNYNQEDYISKMETAKCSPTIILCRPQMGENIGATARAMLNFQLKDLRIVAPRDGWPNERADATAAGAFDIMPPTRVYETLEDAISDLNFTIATSARRRDMVKPLYNPTGAIRELHKRASNAQRIGIVFGAERAGLTNEELSLCQALMTFPTNPQFASLNLAQSVLLSAYEWNKYANAKDYCDQSEPLLDMNDSAPAPQNEITSFIERLENDLEDGRFFRTPNMKPTTMVNIRNIFTRSDVTDQEIRTLHGILSALRGNKTPK